MDVWRGNVHIASWSGSEKSWLQPIAIMNIFSIGNHSGQVVDSYHVLNDITIMIHMIRTEDAVTEILPDVLPCAADASPANSCSVPSRLSFILMIMMTMLMIKKS